MEKTPGLNLKKENTEIEQTAPQESSRYIAESFDIGFLKNEIISMVFPGNLITKGSIQEPEVSIEGDEIKISITFQTLFSRNGKIEIKLKNGALPERLDVEKNIKAAFDMKKSLEQAISGIPDLPTKISMALSAKHGGDTVKKIEIGGGKINVMFLDASKVQVPEWMMYGDAKVEGSETGVTKLPEHMERLQALTERKNKEIRRLPEVETALAKAPEDAKDGNLKDYFQLMYKRFPDQKYLDTITAIEVIEKKYEALANSIK